MRDDFTTKTKEILAKRVTYKCSNPHCRKPTIGPNLDPNKTVLIGVAAHISAASVGGPRYNQDLTPVERSAINNAIWLCQNCSSLIDKDIRKYTVELLDDWKTNAENEAFEALQRGNYEHIPEADHARPYAEAELIWSYSSKRPQGISSKTNEIYGDKPISMMQAIWLNIISWDYELKIYNNSSVSLYNIKVYQHSSNSYFSLKESPPKINNIPPYRDLTLSAGVSIYLEGTGKEADKTMKPMFPEYIQGLRLLLEYVGENRKSYFTELTLNNDSLKVEHLDNKPEGY